MTLFSKKFINLGIYLTGILLANNALAAQTLNSPQQQLPHSAKKRVIYSIYNGDQIVKSNDPAQKVHPILKSTQGYKEPPSYPAPALDSDKLTEFVSTHNNSLPLTWGIDTERTTWKGEQSYSSLGNKDFGTELYCTSTDGCHGEISAAIISQPSVWTSSYSTLSWDHPTLAVRFLNKDNNISSGFYLDSTSNAQSQIDNIIDKIYIADGQGHLNELKPGNNSYSKISYNVKYNEPIGYFLIKSIPNEKTTLWDIDYINTYDTTNGKQEITSANGSDETLSAGTFWQLGWTQYAGENTGYNQTETITHGITKTNSTNLGFQVGEKISANGVIVNEETSFTFQANWGWSTEIQDQTSSSLQIEFPARPERRVLGIYKLMIGVHSKAPFLENFLANNNRKGFNGHIYANPIQLRLARSLPNSVLNAENSTDAISQGGSNIHASVAVDY